MLRNSFISLVITSIIVAPLPKKSFADPFDTAIEQGKSFGAEINSDFLEDLNNPKYDFSDLNSETMQQLSQLDEDTLQNINSSDELIELATQKKNELYQPQENDPNVNSSAYNILVHTRRNASNINLEDDPITEGSKRLYQEIDQNDGLSAFSDCSKSISYSQHKSTNHVPKLMRCNRLIDRSNECKIEHHISVEPVVSLVKANSQDREITNFMNIMPCENEPCFDLWVGADYGQSSNWCEAFHDYLYIKVDHPEAITKVYLSYVKWDDYFAAYIGKGKREELLYNTNGILPIRVRSILDTSNIEAQQKFLDGQSVYVDRIHNDQLIANPRCENKGEDCIYHRCNYGKELMQSSTMQGTDLTALFKAGASEEEPIVFHTITSTADVGNYQAKLKVFYDPTKIIHTDEWTPLDCVTSARAIDQGFASGTYSCEKKFNGIENDCIKVNGLTLCEDQLKENNPLKELSSLCEMVNVKATTTYYRLEGDQENYQLDGCEKLKGKCSFISSKCLSEALDQDQNCYEYEDLYDCGVDFDDETLVANINYDCNGAIRCIGTECVDPSYELSNSYAKASALLNAAQLMGQDLECTGLDAKGNPKGDVDVVCKVFAGTPKGCAVSMKGMGGLEVNCCESPGGITPSEYISALLALPKIDAMIARAGPGSPIYGAYNTIREPIYNGIAKISNSLNEITQPFTSWMENNFGITNTTTASTSNQGILDTFTQILKDRAKDLIKKLIVRSQSASFNEAGGAAMSNEAMSQIESQAEEQAASIVEGLGTALSVVGYVYMVYQIACIASQMIFKCKEDQLALAASKELGNCSYVGQYCSNKVLHSCLQKTFSYCCYSSPLARIIQEQIHDQLGMSISSLDPKAPNCGGIGIDELDQIDWSRIDLSEWTNLLKLTGNFIDQDQISADLLTGSQSMLNIDYSLNPNTNVDHKERKNVMERTVDRIFDIDLNKINRDVNQNTKVDFGGY